MVFFSVFSFLGLELYTVNFYSVCSLCLISLENPFELIAGMMKALAAPFGSPSPLAFGAFLWQNSLDFIERDWSLPGREQSHFFDNSEEWPAPQVILFSTFKFSRLIWRIRQPWGKVTFILPLPTLKKKKVFCLLVFCFYWELIHVLVEISMDWTIRYSCFL